MSQSDPTLLPEPVRASVEAELEPGEGIRWLDQPIPGRMVRAAWPIVLFAIPWTAFALFWMAMAAQGTARASGVASLFPLFGLPFVLIGVSLLATPLWVMRSAKRTVYVVTDRRAIVIRGGLRRSVSVRSFLPEKLTDLRRDQNADGSGSLVFGQDVNVSSRGRRYAADYGFLAVPNVREAEEYVRALARSAARV
jgi:hypothetical protein